MVKKKRKKISLENICDKNDLVLVDTSALGDPIRKPLVFRFSPGFLKKRYNKACNACLNLSMWNEKIREHPEIKFTKGVMYEFEYYWNKKVPEDISLFGLFGVDNQVRDCVMTMIENISFANKIINFVWKNNRVIDFKESQKKLYDSYFKKYDSLVEEIGKVDSVILVSGMISSELGYFPGIITADKKMIKNFDELPQNIGSENLGFYVPLKEFNFRKYYLENHKKNNS